ncbi:M67 family metallopeptidase [Croceicoccus bisphenolivorans]|uniref:M67 family metallopeptidase n=1 Tax=Croceicoccus bisphenolivorans TaxID=1783232 RepID=UPI000833E42F|nr:M67 family metallopeptidase [Croceicoccus bisphenolivorans]
MRIQTASSIRETLIAAARAAHPRECCGLLLGTATDEAARISTACIGEIRPCRNVHADPEHHFEIDPAVLIAAHRAAREGGASVLGYYHSHPMGEPVPSLTDREQSACDGRIWAIVAGERIGWWRDLPEGFEQLDPPV